MRPSNLLLVDLKSIATNVERLKLLLPQKTRIMPMLKASAYGTEAVTLARLYQKLGLPILGTSHTQEALLLRKKGISCNLFVIHAPAFEAKEIVKYDLEVGVSDLTTIEALSKEGKKANKLIKVHLHIDTGMKRFGCASEESLILAQAIKKSSTLALEGIMTHFASAEDPDYDAHSQLQIQLFEKKLEQLQKSGFNAPWIHAQNSAAALRFSLPFCNMVRVGLAPFGYFPSLEPSLSLRSKIVSLHELKSGESLGYNRSYIGQKENERVAICPLGYHDGIHLNYSGKGYALIAGKKAPFVGRICMDFLMLNVTEIAEAMVGSEVLFFGRDSQGNTLPLEEFASFVQTNVREVMTNLGPRIKRIFIHSP